MVKLDVDPHALANEVSELLKQEQKKPEANRMSFKQITAYVYRGHSICGEFWHAYNSAIGKILRARPRKTPNKKKEPSKSQGEFKLS